jgi:hypothetical protein
MNEAGYADDALRVEPVPKSCAGFLKSKSGVVVPGQPGCQILLVHQKYWLPITNRSLMNSSSKSFRVYARWTTDVWQVLARSCEACVPGTRTTNSRNPDAPMSGFKTAHVEWKWIYI